MTNLRHSSERRHPSGSRNEDVRDVALEDIESSAGEVLRRHLYDPPVSFEQLAGKMKVSLVTANPTIAKAAFQQR